MAYDDRDDDDDLDIRQPRQEIPNYLTVAILVTLCCCLPFGIVAIVQASKVNTHLARGEYEQAQRASEEAKKWCWIAAIVGFIANAVVGYLRMTSEAGRF